MRVARSRFTEAINSTIDMTEKYEFQFALALSFSRSLALFNIVAHLLVFALTACICMCCFLYVSLHTFSENKMKEKKTRKTYLAFYFTKFIDTSIAPLLLLLLLLAAAAVAVATTAAI